MMRLAALGHINRRSRHWTKLRTATQNFIVSLLQVKPSNRPTPRDALTHPFLCRNQENEVKVDISSDGPRRQQCWDECDGLQQIAWVAVARAVSDPELSEDMIMSVLASKNGADSREKVFDKAGYTYHLARELATSLAGMILKKRSAWHEVLRLAFSYLDVDRDGILSQRDLMRHFEVGSPATAVPEDMAYSSTITHSDTWTAASGWLERWKKKDSHGLNFVEFCEVLRMCRFRIAS